MYGLLMARLPAVKAAAELSDSLIGLCLFCTGAFGLVGLGGSRRLLEKWAAEWCCVLLPSLPLRDFV